MRKLARAGGFRLSFIMAMTCMGYLAAVDREVGPGKTHATINDALAAASAGDRVVVFSGTYDEQIAWNKDVDIVEATGETAVLEPTDALPGPFLVDITLGAAVEVLWEGIDLNYSSTKFIRLFMNRAGDPTARVVIQNIRVTDDDPLAGGHGRVFTAETGTMELNEVSCVMDVSAGYEMIIGATGQGTVEVSDSQIDGCNDRTLFTQDVGVLRVNRSSINRSSACFPGFLTDFFGGSFFANDTAFKSDGNPTTIRGMLVRFAPAVVPIEVNRCTFEAGAPWHAVAIETAVNATFTNCAFPRDPTKAVQFSVQVNNATSKGTSDVVFEHCTFASIAASGANTGIIDESVVDSITNYTFENCIFHIPGTTVGAVRGNTQGGTVNVTAGTNVVSTDGGLEPRGLLTGDIIEVDPALDTDFIHLTALSPVINLADDIGVTDDIDGDARPEEASPDYGCDEFKAVVVPPPDPPVNVLAAAAPGEVSLTWTTPTGGSAIAGYNVYRTQPAPLQKVNGNLITETNFAVESLPPAPHCFIVRSVGTGVSGVESSDSNEACATPEPVPPPNPPSGLVATAGARSIHLAWTAASAGPEILGYRVYRASPGPLYPLGEALVTGVEFTDDGVPAGQEFCYLVRSVGTSGLESTSTNTACATATPLPSGNVLEVGSGEAFATIQAAIDAAADGDTVMVHAGTYNERIIWNKLVDIVEAPGEEAILHATNDLGAHPLFLVEIVLPRPGFVTWDGIDVLYDSDNFIRLFLSRGNASSNVVIKNMSITDTEEGSGYPRIFSPERGGMFMQNVRVDLDSIKEGPNNPVPAPGIILKGYEFCIALLSDRPVLAYAQDCSFETPGNAIIVSNAPKGTICQLDRCTINRRASGFVAFLTDLIDGDFIFRDCEILGGEGTIRGILFRFGGRVSNLEMTRCRWDASVGWHAIALEKAVISKITNCCFPRNLEAVPQQFSIEYSNATRGGGKDSLMELRHCTFAMSGEHPNNTGVLDSGGQDSRLEIVVENCLFHLPGSTVGAIRDNRQGGETEVIAGVNLRNVLPAEPPAGDLLETDTAGVIVPDDPLLAADLCHLTEDSLPAIDQGDNIGVLDDIDGETRPAGPGPDLGADEFSASGAVGPFVRGDCDGDASIVITDPVVLLNYLFLGGPEPPCLAACNHDGDGFLNITDAIYLLNFLFSGGPEPPAPYPTCLTSSVPGDATITCLDPHEC